MTDGVDKCEHGQFMGFDPTYNYPIAMAAPYFTCQCCEQITFYIASSSMSFNMDTGESHGRSVTPSTTFCQPCGGRTEVTEF